MKAFKTETSLNDFFLFRKCEELRQLRKNIFRYIAISLTTKKIITRLKINKQPRTVIFKLIFKGT